MNFSTKNIYWNKVEKRIKMEIKSVAIIGLGAVGAVVGEQLNKILGNNLSVILDEKRKANYESKGIFINQEKQAFNYVVSSALSPVDLVIIATKNLQIKEAIEGIKNCVGSETMILSLLNGIQSERDLEQAFSPENVLYGFIIDLQSINLSGNITCTGKGRIIFGEKNNQQTPRIQAVKELFDKAGVKYVVPENIQLEMWKKFLINTTFNSLGAITRSTYGGLGVEVMKSAARKIGYEVIEIANAEGIPLTKQMLEDDIIQNSKYDVLGKCSMLQDVEAGRRTENDYFCGTIVALGKKHNIPVPYCQFLGELLTGTEEVREIKEKASSQKA